MDPFRQTPSTGTMSSKWQNQEYASTPDLIKKKVHFQENEENCRNSESTTCSLQTFSSERENLPHIGKYLQISPAHELLFSSNSIYKNECCAVSLQLTNISAGDVAYKVRTTSPLNYRVRPSMGLVKPNATVEVTVHLSKGSPGRSVVHDKFLVMAMPVEIELSDADLTAELNDLWHKSPKEKVTEHKIRCGILPETPQMGVQEMAVGDLVVKMDALSASLHNEIRSLRHYLNLVVGLYVLLLISVLCFVYYKDSMKFGEPAYATDSCMATANDHHPV